MTIALQTPPPETDTPRHPGSEKWRKVAADLKDQPGEWFLIEQDWWQSLANQIRNGQLVAFKPAGAFETRAVKEEGVKGQRAAIYARYVGGEGVETTGTEALTPEDMVAKLRHAFNHYVEPKRSSADPAGLRNGVSLFEAVLRQYEQDVNA